MLRTKEQYQESIFKMRNNVYIGGEAVNRSDDRLMPGINTMSETFDLANGEKYKGVIYGKIEYNRRRN